MSSSTNKPSTSRAKAARSEVNGKPKTVKFRGLEFEVPAEPPGELFWIYNDMERDQQRVGPVVDLLTVLIGEEGVRQVRAKLAEDRVSFQDIESVLSDLIGDIFDHYGMSMGESEASQDS